jgi:hypothetical protein
LILPGTVDNAPDNRNKLEPDTMADIEDDLVALLVSAREAGLTKVQCIGIVIDVFAAQWSAPTRTAFADQAERVA